MKYDWEYSVGSKKNQKVNENKLVRFSGDVYKNNFFLWQDIGKHHTRNTWQKFYLSMPPA